ncbi:MAG: MlaD family protein, partial [Phycisphaeraceae bacterium]
MAAKGFKSNYVHRLTGLMVLVLIVLGVVAVVLMGNAKKWFMPMRSLTVVFPEQGTFGLGAGAEIQILGIIVGKVDEVEVDDQGRVEARTHIREDFFRLIRTDSKALIKKRFGVA